MSHAALGHSDVAPAHRKLRVHGVQTSQPITKAPSELAGARRIEGQVKQWQAGGAVTEGLSRKVALRQEPALWRSGDEHFPRWGQQARGPEVAGPWAGRGVEVRGRQGPLVTAMAAWTLRPVPSGVSSGLLWAWPHRSCPVSV